MSEDNIKLSVTVGAQDIVHLEIGGEINASDISKLNEWAQDVRETIKNQYNKKEEKVLCLVDISKLTKYDGQVLTQLASLMKDNEPYVLKTATFGGNSYMIMAEDIVAALSGRKNLKGFNKKEDALNWLLGEE